MSQWAYEMSNRDLLRTFTEACAEAGVSCSGIVFDPGASLVVRRFRYLEGVLLSRLDGVKPPFKPGDVVQAKDGAAADLKGHWLPPPPGELTVQRVHYAGGGDWLLEFKGIPQDHNGAYPTFIAKGVVTIPSVAGK